MGAPKNGAAAAAAAEEEAADCSTKDRADLERHRLHDHHRLVFSSHLS